MSEQSNRFGDLLQGLALITEALGKSANVQTMGSRSSHAPDLPVQVFLRDQHSHPRFTLVAPHDAAQIARSTDNALVFVAGRIAPKISAAWRSKGQSFIDLKGHVFLELPGLLIDKTVRPQRIARQAQPHPVDPFADRASLISRYLLKHPPGQSWGVRELSSVTQVSLGTTSKIVRALEERHLVVVTRQGRNAAVSVTQPKQLFKAWASFYDWTRNLSFRVQAPVADPQEFLRMLPRKLPSASPKWAVTLQAGAALVAPHATWNQIHLYIKAKTARGLERFSLDLNWPPAPDGRVTLMLPYYRESIWKDVHKHAAIPVVDDLQLALDLWNYPGRGREQAEYILRRKLIWILEDSD